MKHKKIIKNISIILSLFSVGYMFFHINTLNYQKHIEIKQMMVEHPENLPTKETAINTSMGFKNLKADIYWLETIQYIWGNAISSEYKKYLFAMIDLITELNPYFEHPYIIGQLLLPSYNERYENLSEEQQEKHIQEAIQLGKKGVEKFCDPKKIEAIEAETNLKNIWSNPSYKNPCKSYNIPYYLAYIYYFYSHDPATAAKYYKIASANDDSLEWTKIMAAIMQWKWGNREKSFFMFLNIAKYVESENQACITFASELEKIWSQIFLNQMDIDEKLIIAVEATRNDLFGSINEENEEDALSDTKCSNYVNKATRELNLAYIEQANKEYKNDHNGKTAYTALQLFEEGYIKHLPVDFQQYDDYGIVYKYNFDTKNFDYEMWDYGQ